MGEKLFKLTYNKDPNAFSPNYDMNLYYDVKNYCQKYS